MKKYPLTEEERPIYERLVEKYKDNEEALEMIEWRLRDRPEQRNWALTEATIEYIC